MDDEMYAEFVDVGDAHWWFDGRRQVVEAVLRQSLDAAPPPPAGTRRQILDVGCGTGAMLGMLRQFGDVQGLEMYPDAIAACYATYGDEIPVQLGRIPEDLPHDGSLDVVGAFDVVEHIEDDYGLVEHIYESVRPGGLFVATVPAFPILWGINDEMSHHIRRYRSDRMHDVLTSAGFEIERSTHFNTWLFPGAAAVRVGRRLIPAGRRSDKPDLSLTSPRVDKVLAKVFASERHALRHVDLPVGVSLLTLARRPHP